VRPQRKHYLEKKRGVGIMSAFGAVCQTKSKKQLNDMCDALEIRELDIAKYHLCAMINELSQKQLNIIYNILKIKKNDEDNLCQYINKAKLKEIENIFELLKINLSNISRDILCSIIKNKLLF